MIAAAGPLGITYTVVEVARYLRVSQNKICRWIEAGELKPVNVAQHDGGPYGRWRIDKTELERFLRARTPQPQQRAARRRRKSRQADTKEYC